MTPFLIRTLFLVTVNLCVVSVASAQEPPQKPSAIRIGAGGHVFTRLPAEGLAAGGSLMMAGRAGRSEIALEAGTARRDGHNDWRALAGPRLWLTHGATTRLYGHVLAGAMIRLGDAGFSGAAGLGVENQARRVALRFQVDIIHDSHRGAGNLGGRVSLWVVSK